MNKGIFYLILGAITESMWAYGLKHAFGIWWILVIILVLLSFYLLLKSFKYISPGLAYIIYVGIGTAILVIIDAIYARLEGLDIDYLKIFLVMILITGIALIKGAKKS